MKKLLIVSFEINRKDDVSAGYPIACLVASLKSDKGYGVEFTADVCSLDVKDALQQGAGCVVSMLNQRYQAWDKDFIALSCAIWSEPLIRPVMQELRESGFRGVFILGGYQITGCRTEQELCVRYPEGQIFIKSFGETALLQALREQSRNYPLVFKGMPDLAMLPSPYLNGIIEIPAGIHMIRWETKRGCPFCCGFCAYRDLTTQKVYEFPLARLEAELELFQRQKVAKINVIDSVFHIGAQYLDILRKIISLKMSTQFNFQARLETVTDEFLKLCTLLNAHLEFGLQSIHPQELDAIGRRNDMPRVRQAMQKLQEYRIPYEIDLMYGLPYQTVSSFRESIEFCREHGCGNLKAHPLRLSLGTELYDKKAEYSLQEDSYGDFGIPIVTSGNTFSRDDWEAMNVMAQQV